MQRNPGLQKASEQDADVKSAYTMGFWTGSSVATFGCAVIVAGTLYYLGAFH